MTPAERIREQLQHCRQDLINLNRTNRLLYFKATKSTLEILEPAATLDAAHQALSHVIVIGGTAAAARGLGAVTEPEGAPTLVPARTGGARVTAQVPVLPDHLSEATAADLLWRRETRKAPRRSAEFLERPQARVSSRTLRTSWSVASRTLVTGTETTATVSPVPEKNSSS